MAEPSITPPTALSVTLVSAIAVTVLGTTGALLLFAGGLLVQLIAARWGSGPAAGETLLRWTVPFIFPLLAIHAFFNSAYPVDHHLWDVVPVRLQGVQYGLTISLKVLILAIVGAFWLTVRREDFVESLIRSHLPGPLLLLSLQSTAVAGVVRRRIDNVYLAQRARGIPVGSTTWQRLKSLPSALIPVVVATLVEAEARVPALVSRGFGAVQIAPIQPTPFTVRQRLQSLAPLILLLVAIALDRLL